MEVAIIRPPLYKDTTAVRRWAMISDSGRPGRQVPHVIFAPADLYDLHEPVEAIGGYRARRMCNMAQFLFRRKLLRGEVQEASLRTNEVDGPLLMACSILIDSPSAAAF